MTYFTRYNRLFKVIYLPYTNKLSHYN